ncbi:MAG: Ig-like domain-containing protein, partial [Puniceicoccales bacterium]
WIGPDGHGSHPHETDLFYGDIDGQWDDTNDSGNYTAGDGIYDESYYPSEIDLRTGRVTFHNMPSYQKNEVEYLRDYIHKEHAYRYLHRSVSYQNYVGDEYYLYATNASLKPMVGEGNWTDSGTLDTIIGDESYLVAVGQRTGSWDTARDGFQKAIFTACFRSHILQWWDTDNHMRGMLAQPDWGLTALWGARPAWYLHKLAAGRTIGQAALETQNDLLNSSAWFMDGQYEPGRDYEFFSDSVDAAYVSNNLIGDPTVRIAHVEPVHNLGIQQAGSGSIELTWDASPAPDLIGYHVYQSSDRLGPYARLTSDPISDEFFSASAASGEDTWFQVRAVANVTVPTGVYEEQSHGHFALVRADGSVNSAPVAVDFEVVGKVNTPLQFQFEGSDVDGDELTPILLDNPDSGQIRWWEGRPYYVSKRDTPGEETATYVLFDGVTVSEPATITFKTTEFGDTLLAWEFPDGTTTAQGPSFSSSHISSTAIEGGPGTNIISSWPGTDSNTSRYIGS